MIYLLRLSLDRSMEILWNFCTWNSLQFHFWWKFVCIWKILTWNFDLLQRNSIRMQVLVRENWYNVFFFSYPGFIKCRIQRLWTSILFFDNFIKNRLIPTENWREFTTIKVGFWTIEVKRKISFIWRGFEVLTWLIEITLRFPHSHLFHCLLLATLSNINHSMAIPEKHLTETFLQICLFIFKSTL